VVVDSLTYLFFRRDYLLSHMANFLADG